MPTSRQRRAAAHQRSLAGIPGPPRGTCSRRPGTSSHRTQWQFTLSDRLGGVAQGCSDVSDVVVLQVGEVGQDLLRRHPIGDHADHGGDGYPQSTDAGHTAEHLGIGRDPLERQGPPPRQLSVRPRGVARPGVLRACGPPRQPNDPRTTGTRARLAVPRRRWRWRCPPEPVAWAFPPGGWRHPAAEPSREGVPATLAPLGPPRLGARSLAPTMRTSFVR